MKKTFTVECHLISLDFQLITDEEVETEFSVELKKIDSPEKSKKNLKHYVRVVRTCNHTPIPYEASSEFMVSYKLRSETTHEEEKELEENTKFLACHKASLLNYSISEAAFEVPDIYPPYTQDQLEMFSDDD